MSDATSFEPGTLWALIKVRTQSALAAGSLQPIATDSFVVPDADIRFQVRVVSTLVQRKRDGKMGREETKPGENRPNPFLPYEQSLHVADISPTHICLLNKYPVIDRHALIVTRGFEPQETLLTLDDFDAAWKCMREYRSLCFYNSGPTAGASQPHKHLQLVALPLDPDNDLPISPLLRRVDETTERVQLPFRHAYASLESRALSGAGAAAYLRDTYLRLMDQTGLRTGDPDAHPRPYNLLATRDFMLVVPRRSHDFRSVYVNALGMAGSFFVSEHSTLDAIRAIGPMTLLRGVAVPA